MTMADTKPAQVPMTAPPTNIISRKSAHAAVQATATFSRSNMMTTGSTVFSPAQIRTTIRTPVRCERRPGHGDSAGKRLPVRGYLGGTVHYRRSFVCCKFLRIYPKRLMVSDVKTVQVFIFNIFNSISQRKII